VLGLLALPFGVLAPFAIFSATRSLLRIRASDGGLGGTTRASAGLVAGVLGLLIVVLGAGWWVASSS